MPDTPLNPADAPQIEEPEDQSQSTVEGDEGDGEVDPNAEQQEQPAEGEGDPDAEQAEGELAEVEINGKLYLVPADIKDGFLKNADYTRKTQEVAEQRRTIEAQQASLRAEQEMFQAHARVHQENLVDVSRLIGIDDQLQQYQKIDWQKLDAEDPLRSQQLFRQYNMLKDQRAGLAAQIGEKQSKMANETQQATAKRLEEGHAVLARDIPNWGSAVQEKLASFGVSHGLSREEMAAISDPRHVKILHLAMVGEELMKKQRAAATKSAARPQASPVRQVGSRQSPGAGKDLVKDADKMSDDAWLAARNRQVDAKAKAERRT